MSKSLRGCLAFLGLLLASPPGHADFHIFTVNEIYSSADGNVQFIELTALAGGQQFLMGHTISSTSGAGSRNFMFPSNLPGDTAGRKFLIGTTSFAALGVVTPDYVVPDGFLFPFGGTLNYGSFSDVWNHGPLPNDGLFSLNRDGTTAINSPTNFAGATGQVTPPAPATIDLGVTQSSPGAGNVGKDVIFTITVTNSGGAGATNVVVTDLLPAGAAYIWASPGCANAAGTVTCNVGPIAAGASTARKVVVRPSAVGTATNNVSVTASEADPSPGNNAHSAGVTIDSTPAGIAVLRYRLYSDVTKEHHFTTDLNEYNVLGTAIGTWVQEGTVGKVLNNPGIFSGVATVPYYRLYDTSTRWHHWTTDANEYYTLTQFPSWNAEGVDGYILPTAAAGATELYRLNYPFLGSLHHWTIDANEYNTLIGSFGWIGEGGAGFVIQ